MNGYQPPLVPQSAVTFGDERLVDPWAETMLRNTCSNFQVQNMALQQEIALTCGSLVPIEQSIL